MKKELLTDIFKAALAAVDPYQAVKNSVSRKNNSLFSGGHSFDLGYFGRVLVLGAGKAAERMAAAVEELLGDRIASGLIIAKYGQTGALRKIEQREGSHPIPDEAGMQATRAVLDIAGGADEKTLIICLLSGGGSALLVQPAPGISLEEKQKATELLLKAGASIEEMNAVRKHISRVKGGLLARTACPATVLTLILSDVIGNQPDVIASGPTAPDSSTYRDAAAVIDRYSLDRTMPASVVERIRRGVKGLEQETPKSGEPCFRKVANVIIAGNDRALAAALRKAKSLRLAAEVITAGLHGEAREAGRQLSKTALATQKKLKRGEQRCFLSGGETTVTVQGDGIGGRNQELALAFALGIEGVPGITLLSAGTDGIDGPTDAAGAVVDGETAKKAREAGINPSAYLDRNDSYSFFKRFDLLSGVRNHLITGPTGTNVMDLQILCVEKRE